jgi:hypothetical protein
MFIAIGTLGCGGQCQAAGEPEYRSPVFHAAGSADFASRPVQALYVNQQGLDAASRYSDAYGNPAIVPAGYCASCNNGCAECGGGHPGGYGYGGCSSSCGCDGGSNCGMGTYPPFEDDDENYSLLRPFRTEQCGPHYFDIRMEAVFLTRDETFNQQVNFTSLNVVNPMMPDPSQFVVRSDQLDFGTEPGFRIMGRYDIGALSVLEFGYMGLESLDASASFTDPDPVDAETGNLYSLFSDFVQFPALLPAGVTIPDGPLPYTERSITHSITLETELHVAEMTYRRYWVGYNPCVSGTLLCGFRFTRLREDFDFSTSGEAEGQYLMIAKNDLAGFQTGGDVWVHLLRGLRAGAEGKLGLYNNHYTLDTTFNTDPAIEPPLVDEHFEKDIPAFIGEASFDVVADLTPSWSLRAGYEVHFLNSLVLTGENFNTGTVYTGQPGVLLPPRVPFLWDQGNAFYHGGHIGAEFVW